MVGGIVHDVERSRIDAPGVSDQVTGQQPGRGRIFGRPARQPSPVPQVPTRSGKRRRSFAFVIFSLLKRSWLVLVILAVIGAGGMTVKRLHGLFGSEKRLSYADTRTDDTKPVDPQHMRYEIFGPPGALAGISYFDGDGDLKIIKDTPLPWSLEFEITAATAGGNIVAQGNGDTLGCRITIDDVVKDERITHAVSAFTYCRTKSESDE